jgi:hypothetical protein
MSGDLLLQLIVLRVLLAPGTFALTVQKQEFNFGNRDNGQDTGME